MIIRSNKALEETVTTGLQLFKKGECFDAVILMKNHGLPNSVIARVLYEQNRIRNTDFQN
ncbi:MAG: hypothetical protein CTY33_08325 [Methylotenera sp.]|nr:MAG: hypothetical protein CTY33_08325 [Methylotenera sp.]